MSTTPAAPHLSAISLAVAGPPVTLETLPLTEAERARLPRLGQSTVHMGGHSTSLMVEAAARTLERSGRAPADIGLVIAAPSLLTAHGLEIQAVAVRARLGLSLARTLQVQQGCNGILVALDLARDFVQRSGRDALVVTGCHASTLTDNATHGGFFWSDGAGACLVGTREAPGFEIGPYVEASADAQWDAMRVPFGDANDSCVAAGRIGVFFDDMRAQADYIRRDTALFLRVVDELLAAGGLTVADLAGAVLPAFGANRLASLCALRPGLAERLRTDATQGHMGGVDVLLGLAALLDDPATPDGAPVAAWTASFTAQWGGLLLRAHVPTGD